jgi:hypothetical protein
MKSLLCSLSLVLLISFSSSAQTVSGKWYGTGNADFNGGSNNYLIEFILVQKGSVVTGEFNYYFKDAFFANKITGTYDTKTRKLSIKTTPITYFRSASVNGVECSMDGNFTLMVSKLNTTLKGKFSSTSFYAATCPDIVMNLQLGKDEPEEVVQEEEEVVSKTQEEKKINTSITIPSAIKEKTVTEKQFISRKKDDMGIIELDSTNITIQVVDNGEVDKDSVTLFFNEQVLASKIELTKRGLSYNITLDTTIVNEISMFAENLGFIPPNTAVLLIYDGRKRYEINLTSTLQTNGTIRLKKKELKTQ